jgi:hypothetical protein
MLGATIDDAIAAAIDVGPAGEVVRLAGDDAIRRADEVRAAVRAALTHYVDAHGRVVGPTSAWIACGTNPSAA